MSSCNGKPLWGKLEMHYRSDKRIPKCALQDYFDKLWFQHARSSGGLDEAAIGEEKMQRKKK
jgi:hypothetical protein